MNREGMYLFANLFSTKGNVEHEQTMKDVDVTSSAQPHVLRERMKEKELTHGETVTATLSPVRLEKAFGKVYMYFCPMESMEIHEKLIPGDGGDIPSEVTVEGLKILGDQKSGLYTLRNVKLSSNGTMQVIANEKTTWELYSPT
jgi:DNA/RNA endonuclease YhcR with UshA esterase domain